MTDRERMLAAIRGEEPDRIPFVPRLEFWYRARKRSGTLPPELEGLSLVEIADYLGVGYHAVTPNLAERSDELDMIDYAIGIYRSPVLLFEPVIEEVERRVRRDGKLTAVEYRTPVGSIETVTTYTEEMLDAGASVPWRTRHAIEKPEDIDVVGFIFSHTRLEPRLERWEAQQATAGERGLVFASASGSACPIHHILRELMPVEQFFYAYHDYPEKIHWLAEQMEPYYEGVKEICAASGAPVVMLGGNYDDAITFPRFFRQHILPALRDYAERLHRRGKFLATHTDGENRRLLGLYREADIDVADSVCPYPMTSVRLEEFFEAFAGKITVIGGIPSVLLCRDSCAEEDFRRKVDELLARYAHQSRFILGVSDMVTADAEWDRLRYLAERVRSLDGSR
jgi:uncharacterized coiled-coil protein SlyX